MGIFRIGKVIILVGIVGCLSVHCFITLYMVPREKTNSRNKLNHFTGYVEKRLNKKHEMIKPLTHLFTSLPPLNIGEELKLIENKLQTARDITGKSSEFTGKITSPVNHIAFLKVHKSASTTAQNIFLRYGLMRNLTFVLPIVPNKLFDNVISLRESVTSSNIFPPPKNESFDILCCHVIYNHNAFRKFMPADTAYIGIVRHPFNQFKSTVSYFRHKTIMQIKSRNKISEYLKRPWTYDIGEPRASFFNNRQAVEFGFPEDAILKRNKSFIAHYLNKLDKEFLVVLIVEYFDESLLLMKRLLKWNLKDILYVTRNKTPKSRKKFYLPLTGDFTNLRHWASVDYELYHYFNKRLRTQIQKQGGEFYDELLQFKEIQRRVDIFCKDYNGPKEILVKPSKWNKIFTVTNLDCIIMELSEIKFVRYLRERQYPHTKVTVSQ